jgi:hypothetical protein
MACLQLSGVKTGAATSLGPEAHSEFRGIVRRRVPAPAACTSAILETWFSPMAVPDSVDEKMWAAGKKNLVVLSAIVFPAQCSSETLL